MYFKSHLISKVGLCQWLAYFEDNLKKLKKPADSLHNVLTDLESQGKQEILKTIYGAKY